MIETSLLHSGDLPALAALWTQALGQQDDACTLSERELEEHVLLHGGEPRAILAIDPRGWIVARSEDVLIGFVHCTVGRLQSDDAETMRGILRTLVLATDAPAATTGVLLRTADNYFRTKTNLTNIIAFHLDTGYPRLAYGRGTVMNEQWSLMDAMGKAGYRLAKRWLFFERTFTAPIPERQPRLPDMTLRWENRQTNTFTLAAWSGLDVAARARFMIFPQSQDCTGPGAASLYQIEVAPDYQQQGIGRWLLERGANHLIASGVTRLLADAPHEDALIQSNLLSLSFHECPLRGYTYEKPHA